MNTYEIDIWCGVKFQGEFRHNARRAVFVHALNEEIARKKVELKPAHTMGQLPNQYEVSAESIYSIRKTGTVTIQKMYVYSDGRNPQPVKRG